MYDSIAQAASEHVGWDTEFTPNPANRSLYDTISQNWVEAYRAQLALVDKNITTSMWEAPGL